MIQCGYACKVDENQKLAVLVNVGGKAYADKIFQETVICNIKSEKMTAKRLVETMQLNFMPNGGADSDDEDSINETALVTGAFQYKCYNCGAPSNTNVTTVESKVIEQIDVFRRKATSPLAENAIIVAERVTRKPIAGSDREMKARDLHILQPGARKKLQEPRLMGNERIRPATPCANITSQ